jgi:hypothetical protein
MGYWIGYRIDQAFYAQAKDKTAACEPCWGVTDFKACLKLSGYPVRREPCVPEKPAAPANCCPVPARMRRSSAPNTYLHAGVGARGESSS